MAHVHVEGSEARREGSGDRDRCGARVGALLQALLAGEPGQLHPTIRAWLPSGFLPPQVTIASAVPATDVIGARMLSGVAAEPPLSSHDVLFWRNDLL